jgi:hypothetical protein
VGPTYPPILWEPKLFHLRRVKLTADIIQQVSRLRVCGAKCPDGVDVGEFAFCLLLLAACEDATGTDTCNAPCARADRAAN